MTWQYAYVVFPLLFPLESCPFFISRVLVEQVVETDPKMYLILLVTVIAPGKAHDATGASFLVLCALVVGALIFFFTFLRLLFYPRMMLSSNLHWIVGVDYKIYLKYYLKFKMLLYFIIGMDITVSLISHALLQCDFAMLQHKVAHNTPPLKYG